MGLLDSASGRAAGALENAGDVCGGAEGGSASVDGAGGAAVGPGRLGTAMVDDKSIARMNQVIPARQARTSAIIIMAESSRWETLRFKRGLLSSSMSTPKRLPMASDASPFKGRAQAQVLFMPRDARVLPGPGNRLPGPGNRRSG